MFIKNLNLYLEITYIVRQENIIPQGFFLVFGGSIPNFSRKCKSDFNKNIISGRARFKDFSRTKSKDLLCYADATLQDATYDAAIIHVDRESRSNDTVDVQLEKDKRKMQIVWRKTCFCFRLNVYLQKKKDCWLTLIE